MDNAKNAINKVKEAEKTADLAVKQAEAQSQKAILDTKLESKEILFWAEVDAIAQSHGILTKAKATIAQELDKISKNTQKEKQELTEKAKTNLPKAINFILDEFLKYYGNSKT